MSRFWIGGCGGGRLFYPLVLPAAAANGDVAEGAAAGPVALAGLAEMSGLGEAVIVVVAELGIGGVAAGAFECGLLLLCRPIYNPSGWRSSSSVDHLVVLVGGTGTSGVAAAGGGGSVVVIVVVSGDWKSLAHALHKEKEQKKNMRSGRGRERG